MSFVLRAGSAPVVAFWWWEHPTAGRRLAFATRAEARACLARLGTRPEDVRCLRHMLAYRLAAPVSRLDDFEVLDQLAHLLAAGQLRLAALPRENLAARDGAAEQKPALPPPNAARRAAPEEVQRPVEPPTFSDALDAELLAAAMKEAARQGVPFCEECEKAKLANERRQAAEAAASKPAAPPAPPVGEAMFSEAVDAELLATAMKEAARQGVPFCEECEKAKLANERRQAAKSAPALSAKGPAAALPADAAPVVFSEDTDAAATADAMKNAAQLGVPFCEECMKKELEAKRAAKGKGR
jgi:hypothetical protein